MEYLAATKFKMHPEKYKYCSKSIIVFNSIDKGNLSNLIFSVLNYNSCETILARDLVTGGSVRVRCNSRLDVGVWGGS